MAAGIGILDAVLGKIWDSCENFFANILSYLIPGLLVGIVFALIGFLRSFLCENNGIILRHFLIGFAIGAIYELIRTIRYHRFRR